MYLALLFISIYSICSAEIVETSATGDTKGKMPPDCKDFYQFCQEYAAQGHCELNVGWMIMNCPRSCSLCHLRDPSVRCTRNFLNMTETASYQPGDMNAMFEALERDYGDYGVEVLSRDPWIVQFNNFVSDLEANALIETQTHWQRSTETGTANEFGSTGRVVGNQRTSSNSWCFHECESNSNVAGLISRMEAVTRLDKKHHESLQVLRYEIGERYTTHHDHAAIDSTRPAGARALTFLLYLSDVEEGGETDFPRLGLSIKPQKGKAVLWANTLNDNPQLIDERTYHQALPVVKGRKYAANAWIHLYDYQVPDLWGCTGTF